MLTMIVWWQVWRYGSGYHGGEGGRGSLLAQRSPRHRTSGSGHRLQLQSDLSPESEIRQKKGTTGRSGCLYVWLFVCLSLCVSVCLPVC